MCHKHIHEAQTMFSSNNINGAEYLFQFLGPGTGPWGKPNSGLFEVGRVPLITTYFWWPVSYDFIKAKASSLRPKAYSNYDSSIPWLIVSSAAERSKRINKAAPFVSTAISKAHNNQPSYNNPILRLRVSNWNILWAVSCIQIWVEYVTFCGHKHELKYCYIK